MMATNWPAAAAETCRTPRCAISPFIAMTSSSERTDARSGFSTTLRRCAGEREIAKSFGGFVQAARGGSFSLEPQYGHAAAARYFLPGRIRPTEPLSITT